MGIIRDWKIFLIAILSSCAHKIPEPTRHIRVYSIQPDDLICPLDSTGAKASWCAGLQGLYHPSTMEVKPLSEARSFIAISPEDFQQIPLRCPH